MNTSLLVNIAVVALAIVPLHANVLFGPVVAGSGKSVRLVSQTLSQGGTIEIENHGRINKGTILHTRERDLTWTFREPSLDGARRGMLTVTRISTTSSVTLDGKTETNDDQSPLNGKMVAMSKPASGDWKFELDGSVPMHRIDNEMSELNLYLNRKWYPQRSVKLGESWEFDPAWIRMLIERDLEKAQTIGTMRLLQLRHTAGKDLAVIEVSIRSTGGNFLPDGTSANAQLELSGQVFVDLKTMLDESLELRGTLISRTGKPGNTKTVTLPLTLKVTKTFVGY